MSRTAKDYIPYLFKRLLEFLSPEKSGSLNKQIKIKEVSVDVQERFSRKILVNTEDLIPLATGGFAVKMSCESTSSLVLIGSKIKSEEFKDLSDDAFKYSEVFDEALFLILAKEFEQYLNIKSQVSAEYIEDVLDIISVPNYKGHAVEEFSNFYDPVYVVNIASDSILADNDTMGLVIELSRFVPSLLHCQDMKFINLINGLSKSKYIDKSMLYESLTSFYSKHAFLDIYRCLEKLFYFSWMYLLSQNLSQNFLKDYSNLNLNLDELKNICEKNLSWQSKEDQSIIKLFQLVLVNEDGSIDENSFKKIYNESIFSNLDNLVDQEEINSDQEENINKKRKKSDRKASLLARNIYMYRNSLVHHEDKEHKEKVKKLSDKEWQVLANSVAYFLLAFIQKFDNTLEEQS